MSDTATVTAAEAARDFANAFETATRDNGETFTKVKDGSPEWMHDAVHAAHGDVLPDDWRYGHIHAIASTIAETLEHDPDADLDDARSEIVDGLVDVYTTSLLTWVSSHISRVAYCDQALEDGLIAQDSGLAGLLAAGQYLELEEIYSAVAEAITTQ